MIQLNKVMVIGLLSRDPELKQTPSGVSVCTFGVAVNRTTVSKGVKKESVEYINVVAYGKTAENSNNYLKKGSQVSIEGRLQTRNWDDKDTGKKLYRTEVIVDTLQFGSHGPNSTLNSNKAVTDTQQVAVEGGGIDYGPEINPEDIPF